MWNAQLSESSKFWTHIALPEKLGSKFDRVLLKSLSKLVVCCFWRDFNLKVIFSPFELKTLLFSLFQFGVKRRGEKEGKFFSSFLWTYCGSLSHTLFFPFLWTFKEGKERKSLLKKLSKKKRAFVVFLFSDWVFFFHSQVSHTFFFFWKKGVFPGIEKFPNEKYSENQQTQQWLFFWVIFVPFFFPTIVVNTKKREQNFNFFLKPRFKFDYPLNLSISLSGGKESNNDSPSNGEWTGKSSSFQPSCGFCLWYFDHCWGCGVKGNGLFERKVWLKCFGISCHGGWEPRSKLLFFFFQTFWSPFFPFRVALLESATWSGWYIPPKAQYLGKTDSKQVPWGKDEKNFEKRVKKYVKPVKGKLMSNFWSNESSCSEVYVGFFWWRFCCCFSVILFLLRILNRTYFSTQENLNYLHWGLWLNWCFSFFWQEKLVVFQTNSGEFLIHLNWLENMRETVTLIEAKNWTQRQRK